MTLSPQGCSKVLLLLMLVVTKVFAGWFPNSELIGDRVRIRDAPSYEAKTIGLAREGFRFDLLYIEGEWGRIVTHDDQHLIDMGFTGRHYIGWMHIKYIRYWLNIYGYQNLKETLRDSMLINKQIRAKYIEILNKLVPENSDSILDLLKKFDIESGYSSFILLNDLRNEYISKLVNLLSLEDSKVTGEIKQRLSSLSYRDLAYESVKEIISMSEDTVLRKNIFDFLYRLSAYEYYPVDREVFIKALNDSIKEIREKASLYFSQYTENNTNKILNTDDLKKIIKLYPAAIEAVKPRLRFIISRQLQVIYKFGLQNHESNNIEDAIEYYKMLLDLIDFADQNNYNIKYNGMDIYKKVPEIKEFLENK